MNPQIGEQILSVGLLLTLKPQSQTGDRWSIHLDSSRTGRIRYQFDSQRASPIGSDSLAFERVDRVDDFLSPVSIDERTDPLGAHPSRNKKRCSDKGFLAVAEAEYLEILDWLARNRAAGKRGSTPVEAPVIFERLGIDSDAWSQMVQDFGRMFKNVAGKSTSILHLDRAWAWGGDSWGGKEPIRLKIPLLTSNALCNALHEQFPRAQLSEEVVNAEHRSWRVTMTVGDKRLEFVWGPLSGFGGINPDVEDENAFAYCDEYLYSLDDAVRFAMLHNGAMA